MILFRCDSSFQIGTGHVIRCLNLAHLLKKLNYQIIFISANLPGNINKKILEAGFQMQVAHLNDVVQIQSLKPKWTIVDHYGLDNKWERSIRDTCKLFVIDDLLRKHDCDVLLDQNFRSDYSSFKDLAPPECRLLLGPRYCLLSPDLQQQPRPQPSKQFKVLVFFGGIDERNDLEKIYRAITNADSSENVTYTLVALSSHRALATISSLRDTPKCKILIDPPNWHLLMQQSDFYLGSGGTVTWERLFLGLPGAVIAVADNQVSVSEQVAKAGLQYYWGDSKNISFAELPAKIETALRKPESLKKMSASACAK